MYRTVLRVTVLYHYSELNSSAERGYRWVDAHDLRQYA